MPSDLSGGGMYPCPPFVDAPGGGVDPVIGLPIPLELPLIRLTPALMTTLIAHRQAECALSVTWASTGTESAIRNKEGFRVSVFVVSVDSS